MSTASGPSRRDGSSRYPILATTPRYDSAPVKISGDTPRSLPDLLESLTVIAALVLTLWLAWLLLSKSASLSIASMGWLLIFWGLMAYLALPRLHQMLTVLYVPNYFIARTRTGDGLLGDPVNLGLEGNEEDIHAAMRAAGWTLADDITLASSWGIIKSSVAGSSYPEAPVSDLYLFGEKQAFAYQQEVDGNAAQRHHVRFWPTPEGWILPGGHRVKWLAAGTYDRSVGLSLFTGQVTHKIDANIDLERDYIINTVRYADPNCDVEIIEDFSAAYHSRNGGGDMVSTDGDLPVLDVTGAAARHSVFSAAAVSEKKPARLHLPPFPFLLVGILTGLAALLMLISWGVVGAAGIDALEGVSINELVTVTGIVAVVSVLWILTALRQRWARLLLIAFAIIGAAQDLLSVTTHSGLSSASLFTAGASVMILWAISSDSMRTWVSPTVRHS